VAKLLSFWAHSFVSPGFREPQSRVKTFSKMLSSTIAEDKIPHNHARDTNAIHFVDYYKAWYNLRGPTRAVLYRRTTPPTK